MCDGAYFEKGMDFVYIKENYISVRFFHEEILDCSHENDPGRAEAKFIKTIVS
jgi:hypothetical protein